MNANARRSLFAVLGVSILACTGMAQAHPPAEQWALANEYPASTLAGEGDEFFAKSVADKTRGKIAIVTMPDAKLGYKSREQLKAVAEGKIAMADSFAGAIAEDHAIFGLASLPFVVRDVAQARALYDAARPAYEKAFAKFNQKLLYSTPWPPTGLWTKRQATTLDAVKKLRVRTYDQTGTDLFRRLGASASLVSFADLPAKLAAGEIDAVLSSGDGGAARKLWDVLTHFDEINYAIPLSFTTVNLDKWKALDAPTRRAVEAAAAESEAHQWQAVEARVRLNYKHMRDRDMAIHDELDDELRVKLREAGRAAVDEWAAKAGPEGKALLDGRR
jgi:TRAP-type C4-dicarboxylate transport system substrate-binding protein